MLGHRAGRQAGRGLGAHVCRAGCSLGYRHLLQDAPPPSLDFSGPLVCAVLLSLGFLPHTLPAAWGGFRAGCYG